MTMDEVTWHHMAGLTMRLMLFIIVLVDSGHYMIVHVI